MRTSQVRTLHGQQHTAHDGVEQGYWTLHRRPRWNHGQPTRVTQRMVQSVDQRTQHTTLQNAPRTIQTSQHQQPITLLAMRNEHRLQHPMARRTSLRTRPPLPSKHPPRTLRRPRKLPRITPRLQQPTRQQNARRRTRQTQPTMDQVTQRLLQSKGRGANATNRFCRRPHPGHLGASPPALWNRGRVRDCTKD